MRKTFVTKVDKDVSGHKKTLTIKNIGLYQCLKVIFFESYLGSWKMQVID